MLCAILFTGTYLLPNRRQIDVPVTPKFHYWEFQNDQVEKKVANQVEVPPLLISARKIW